MFQRSTTALLLLLATAGYGATACTAGEKSDASPPAKAASAEKPAASSEMEKAESRKYSTPAVDTSQLRVAPDWTLQDLDGKTLSSKDLRGKVVLIDFWATWCGPCRRSIPHLIDLHNEYKDKGLVVVGVSVDQQGPQVVKPFVAQNKIPYRIVMQTGKVIQDFGGIRGIPTAFIITQDGKIYRKIVGLVPREKYEDDIKALLGLS
jgi:thiol-disulfide isomerase/thioredoxin